ncbi:Gp15 family bacteriophage protein [Lacticaseibacillus porcinae]|uniref:Gp15 family bacteriophage protein n=1 Tax=Lacticaseibacillus porcinae TaxID=1123687 RepID=UPI000F775FC9|nr:Gp15 family bacteriophage protein [Lacticaseibacillus porcinae]
MTPVIPTNSNETIDFNGYRYRLNLSYTRVITLFKVLQDDGLSEDERVRLALLLLVRDDMPKAPDQRQQLLQKIMTERVDLKEHALAAKLFKSHEKVFDFDVDAGRIAASFLQQYNIDLTNVREQKKLSWAFFNALLDGLGENTPFRQATAYRTLKIPDDADPERKTYLEKMKTLYALNDDQQAEEPTFEQATAGMDRIQRMKYLAQQLKAQKG